MVLHGSVILLELDWIYLKWDRPTSLDIIISVIDIIMCSITGLG